MGLLDILFGGNGSNIDNMLGIIDYGKQKKDGGHDHRTNTGEDRTPAQKEGDKNKRKIL